MPRSNTPKLDRAFDEFCDLLKSRGLADRTLANYYATYLNLKSIGKDLDQITATDLVDLERRMREDLGYAPTTTMTRKTMVGSFLQHALIGPDAAVGQYPDCVVDAWRRGKKHRPLSEPTGLEEVTKGRIHIKDLKEIIKAVGLPKFGEPQWTLRNKALFAFYWDSGARRAEALDVKVRDVRFEGESAVVKVKGKTGVRRIPLAWSVPYLKRWLSSHPYRDDPSAALFCKSTGGPLKRDSVWDKFKKAKDILVERGYQLEPETSIHSFRHGRAWYAKTKEKMSDEQMRVFFGWSKGSRMPSRYGGEADVSDVVLGHWGLQTDAAEKGELPRALCGSCGGDNPPDAAFCQHCGAPQTDTAASVTTDLKTRLDNMQRFVSLKYMLEELGGRPGPHPKIYDELLDEFLELMPKVLGEADLGDIDGVDTPYTVLVKNKGRKKPAKKKANKRS